jgi:hypothetical protein
MFEKILDLHTALGLPPLNQIVGGWAQPLPGGWHMVVNGGDNAIEAKIPGFMTVTVPPYAASFWFNGFYAGEIRPYVNRDGQVCEDGFIAAGEAANQETLIAAFDAAISAA